MKKHIDLYIIITVFLILGVGHLLIYSATSGGPEKMTKQLIYTGIGCLLGTIAFFIPTKIYRNNAHKIYMLNFFMLLSVLFFGTNINGAKRWFSLGFINLQPSEISKIFMIICLSVYLYNRRSKVQTSKIFWSSFLYTLLPLVLIFKEPDLGTSLVILFLWFAMNLILGTNIRNLIVFIILLSVLSACVWYIPGFIKPYQKERLITFINPEADELEGGYHVTQSKIAIGSGGVKGKGFLKGNQRALKFIPEQHTDFIFTVLGEEWGFLGCIFLIILYGILIFRLILVALRTNDFIGRGIVVGVISIFIFHIFTNIGMTLGIMPVTGLPLLMVSYGGTSLITNLVAIGLCLGVDAASIKNDVFGNNKYIIKGL